MRGAPVAVVAVLALVATACTSGPGTGQLPLGHGGQRPAVGLEITPAGGTRHADPDGGVTVVASHGTIRSVTVTGGPAPVRGSVSSGGTVWHSRWALHPSTAYTVTATAVGLAGQAVTRRSAFRTRTPAQAVRVTIAEGHGQAYGVGMPVILTFSHPVTRKARVERSLRLWASKPVVGAWYWEGSQTVVFRPRAYWPQRTRVRFTGHLDGVRVAPGAYATANLTQSFRIGNSLVTVVSTVRHQATVYYHGRVVGVWPVSTGAPGRDTANGTYLTIEKQNPALMTGPGYTNLPVAYAVRFTYSGNYLHSAPWSVAQQGYVNVSHGCVNLSPEHAVTYYGLAVPGDPVTVTGSPVAGTWGDGWTEWFLSWHQLLAGSATHQAVQAGPGGSRFVSPGSVPPSPATAPLERPERGNSLPG
jgi:lipoprotein-anchoring transpeptidase ErfK/SrfK